jgi:hypothetical protein
VRVIDPAAAVVRVEKYLKATSLISQTTLRSVLRQAELDELLSHRDKINLRLQEIIDRQTDPWGIKVTAVEVRFWATSNQRFLLDDFVSFFTRLLFIKRVGGVEEAGKSHQV